jgi:hypothetical protein
LGQFKNSQGLLARYAGELSQKFIERFTTREEFEEMGDRDSGSGEARCTAHPLWIHTHNVFDVQILTSQPFYSDPARKLDTGFEGAAQTQVARN